MTDIEIAHSITPLRIEEVAKKLNISKDELEFYGNDKAKIDVDKIKNESQDIIKERIPSDITMLLRKETDDDTTNATSLKKISLEDQVTNTDMGELVKPESLTINPFQEVEPEIMNFEMPTRSTNIVNETKTNSLIDEFRQQQAQNITPPIESVQQAPNNRSLSSAINMARAESKKIESLGFNVDTEEFDFEDMYQIIIKIKK